MYIIVVCNHKVIQVILFCIFFGCSFDISNPFQEQLAFASTLGNQILSTPQPFCYFHPFIRKNSNIKSTQLHEYVFKKAIRMYVPIYNSRWIWSTSPLAQHWYYLWAWHRRLVLGPAEQVLFSRCREKKYQCLQFEPTHTFFSYYIFFPQHLFFSSSFIFFIFCFAGGFVILMMIITSMYHDWWTN